MPCNCGKRKQVDARASHTGVTYVVSVDGLQDRTFLTMQAAKRYADKYDGEIRAVSAAV